jgi:hypothetical protein
VDHLKIQRRAGHAPLATSQGNIREAENLAGAFGEVFPTLPVSIGVTRFARSELRKPRKNPGDLVGARGFAEDLSS